MSYLKVVVGHPDFEFDGMRESFVEGLRKAWSAAMEAQGMDVEPPAIRTPDRTVDVYIAYGESIDGVRDAERTAATMMLSVSYGVVMSNHEKTKPVLAAYEFAIERDVSLAESPESLSSEPDESAGAVAARS